MNRKAFTLIELLVVISIVALLSSVVLASLNSAREKGRIAAALQFEANVYHALGAEAVGVYPMEEGSGASTADLGGGTSGSISNATWTAATAYASSKQALSFNGSSAYVSFASCGISSKLAGATGVTTSRWIYLDGLPSAGNFYMIDFLTMGGGGAGHAVLMNSDGTVGVQGRSSAADSLQAMNGSAPLSIGRWYHILASVDYTADTMSIYIDGKLDAKASATFGSAAFTPQACATTDRIGSSPTPDRYFAGRIDGYCAFGQAF